MTRPLVHFPPPQFSTQRFERNNYRIRALNEALARQARLRGLPVVDFYSVSLAAGCGPALSRDVIHFHQPVYAAHSDLLLRSLGAVDRKWPEANSRL
jgi:hypothetical protein